MELFHRQIENPSEILAHDLALYLLENRGPLFLDSLADLLTISRLSPPKDNKHVKRH